MHEDLEDKDPIFLSTLNGAFLFTADVLRDFAAPCQIEFIKLKSYEGTVSTGKVKERLFDVDVTDRHVVILEDIVDTGRTIAYIHSRLMELGARSIKVCSLLIKSSAYQGDIAVDYLGFDIENRFVIGYGLDFDGYGRNLAEIFQLLPPKT